MVIVAAAALWPASTNAVRAGREPADRGEAEARRAAREELVGRVEAADAEDVEVVVALAGGVAVVVVGGGEGDVPLRAERVLDDGPLGIVEDAVVDDRLADVAVEESAQAVAGILAVPRR